METGAIALLDVFSQLGGDAAFSLDVVGDAVASAIIGTGVRSFEKIGINDIFGQSGKPADLLKEYGLTGRQIADRVLAKK